MVRESEKRSKDVREQDGETGATEGRTGRRQTPSQSAADSEDAEALQELRVTVLMNY